jgi:hypothetical protein
MTKKIICGFNYHSIFYCPNPTYPACPSGFGRRRLYYIRFSLTFLMLMIINGKNIADARQGGRE